MSRSPAPRPGRHAALALPAAALLALVAVSAPAAVAGQDGPVRLRLEARQGETATYRFENTTHVTPPPSMGMETTADVTVVLRRRVEEVEGDTIRFVSTVEDYRLDLESESQDVRSQLRGMAEKSRRDALGSEFPIAVTRRGEVLRIGERAGAAGGGSRLEQSLRQLTFVTLPREPVSAGDRWESRDTMDASAFRIPVEGQVAVRSVATLQRIFRRDGGRVAEIGVESTFDFRPSDTGQQMMKVEMTGSSAQTVRFDVDRGRFLSSSGAQDFTVNLSLPGQVEGSFTVQGNSESSATLVED